MIRFQHIAVFECLYSCYSSRNSGNPIWLFAESNDEAS